MIELFPSAAVLALAILSAAAMLASAIRNAIPRETTQRHTGVTRQVYMSKAEWEEEQRLHEEKR